MIVYVSFFGFCAIVLFAFFVGTLFVPQSVFVDQTKLYVRDLWQLYNSDDVALFNTKSFSRSYVNQLKTDLYVSAICLCLSLLIFLPMKTTRKVTSMSPQNQYSWLVSGTFATGYELGVLLLVMWFIVSSFLLERIFKLHKMESDLNAEYCRQKVELYDRTVSLSYTKRISAFFSFQQIKKYICTTVFLLVHIACIIAINVVYVVLKNKAGSSLSSKIDIMLIVFKIFWLNIVISRSVLILSELSNVSI